MVEISLYGSGEGPGWVTAPGYSTAAFSACPISRRSVNYSPGEGINARVGLLGDDLETLSKIGVQIEGVLSQLPGTASVYSERVVGGNYVNIRVRREDAARYGLNVAAVQAVVQSTIGGMNVTETVEGLERYPINVRFPHENGDVAAVRILCVQVRPRFTLPLRSETRNPDG